MCIRIRDIPRSEQNKMAYSQRDGRNKEKPLYADRLPFDKVVQYPDIRKQYQNQNEGYVIAQFSVLYCNYVQ